MHSKHVAVRAASAFAVLAVAVTICACASTDAIEPGQHAGLACVDDSPACISHRQAALRQMVGDSKRSWVREPATPVAYATGVRLFAFKSKKKELSCDELAVGRREADGAPGALRGPGGKGLTPAQVSRGVMFAAEVSRELGNEMGRRCKKA
jgi:hypothetical protein